MKALYFDGEARLRDIPKPVPGSDEALIEVSLAGVCNTDLEIVKGYMSFSGVMGHEFIGRVVECSDASWVGKRVAGEINLSCGTCEYCRRGLERHCPNRTTLGISGKDGAIAEYLALPVVNLHALPDRVPDESAVFVEPLAAALEILEQVEVKPDDRVVILGDGKLGLLISMVMALKSGHVTLAGKHPEKLALVKGRGVSALLVSDAASAFEAPFDKADIAVEATGNPDGLKNAIEWLRPRGTLVLKSTYAGEACVDLSRVVVNELTLVGSRCGPFDKALSVLEKGALDPRPLITAEYPLAEAEAALSRAMEKDSLKVVIRCRD